MKVEALIVLTAALVGCGYSPTVGEYSVGGVVSGLSTEGILLSDAAGSAVYVSSDGRFNIENAFTNGSAYDISVAFSGLGDAAIPQTRCTVDKGAGVIDGSNVADVSGVCTPATYRIGGTVTGLDGIGLILGLDDDIQSVTLAEDGSFQFTTPLLAGSSYEVAIEQQPESGKCTISNEKGTLGNADVSNVLVSCSSD